MRHIYIGLVFAGGFISGRLYPLIQDEISVDRFWLGVITAAVMVLPIAGWDWLNQRI